MRPYGLSLSGSGQGMHAAGGTVGASDRPANASAYRRRPVSRHAAVVSFMRRAYALSCCSPDVVFHAALGSFLM